MKTETPMRRKRGKQGKQKESKTENLKRKTETRMVPRAAMHSSLEFRLRLRFGEGRAQR
jgi:hypothetical protein